MNGAKVQVSGGSSFRRLAYRTRSRAADWIAVAGQLCHRGLLLLLLLLGMSLAVVRRRDTFSDGRRRDVNEGARTTTSESNPITNKRRSHEIGPNIANTGQRRRSGVKLADGDERVRLRGD